MSSTGTTPTTVELNVAQVMRAIYWGILGVGALLVLIGFSGRDHGYLIAACFLGITSRIVQAEYHAGLVGRAGGGTPTS